MYREILDEMWFDGILTEKEAAELEKIRSLFNITDEEHTRLEKEIKTEAYVQALRIVLHDGVVSENEERVLELMRRRYGITMEDHKDAEAKILEVRRSPPSLGTILIVDDEKIILLTYSAILRRHGYTVTYCRERGRCNGNVGKTNTQFNSFRRDVPLADGRRF